MEKMIIIYITSFSEITIRILEVNTGKIRLNSIRKRIKWEFFSQLNENIDIANEAWFTFSRLAFSDKIQKSFVL
jgi:hypothetical protein